VSAPTTISITYISTPPSTTSVATISIPAGLQTLDSTGQQGAGQTGYDAPDVLISSIFKRGFFYTAGRAAAIPVEQIVSITWS
jgi:hypothetical protein